MGRFLEMGSRDCPYPVPGDAWFEKKKKKRQNPDLDSQTSPGAVELDPQWGWGQEPGILHSPPRHPKAHSVSLTLGRGGGGLPLLAPLPC